MTDHAQTSRLTPTQTEARLRFKLPRCQCRPRHSHSHRDGDVSDCYLSCHAGLSDSASDISTSTKTLLVKLRWCPAERQRISRISVSSGPSGQLTARARTRPITVTLHRDRHTDGKQTRIQTARNRLGYRLGYRESHVPVAGATRIRRDPEGAFSRPGPASGTAARPRTCRPPPPPPTRPPPRPAPSPARRRRRHPAARLRGWG